MPKYIERAVISHDAALQAVELAVAEGKKIGVAVSVAIVDSSMNLVAFVKTDEATPHSAETSRRKANTAASTGKATGWMPTTLELKLPLASNNKLTNIPGGLPIIFDKKLVGAIGIAGGTVEQDEAIAKSTISALTGGEINE